MQLQASIIIPIRAKAVAQRELHRLERLVETIPEGYEALIVDDGSPRSVRKWIEAFVVNMATPSRPVRSLHLKTRFQHFSLARARNEGAKAAASPVVIFHDVDFLAAPAVYRRLLSHIESRELATRPEHFFCVPVAFLSEEGTLEFLYSFHQGEEAWCFRDRCNHPEHLMHFLVQGSSCIVTNRDDLLAMGGHDEGFKGHGAEDFELLHRLSSRYPIAPRPPEYTRNMGSGAITEYRGFRAYFALYGEECRARGCTFVHLWHPKRKGFGYYRHKQNFGRLAQVMQRDEPTSTASRQRPQLSPETLFEQYATTSR